MCRDHLPKHAGARRRARCTSLQSVLALRLILFRRMGIQQPPIHSQLWRLGNAQLEQIWTVSMLATECRGQQLLPWGRKNSGDH